MHAMRWLAALLLLPAVASAQAQDCVNNTDAAGNVCTAFTLGPPTSNCIPVLTQDGQSVPGHQDAGALIRLRRLPVGTVSAGKEHARHWLRPPKGIEFRACGA